MGGAYWVDRCVDGWGILGKQLCRWVGHTGYKGV